MDKIWLKSLKVKNLFHNHIKGLIAPDVRGKLCCGIWEEVGVIVISNIETEIKNEAKNQVSYL